MSNAPPKRRWPRFSLRTLFLVVTIVGVSSGWIFHQLNWIRQRRALAEQGNAIRDRADYYISTLTSDELPPAGSTLGQRLLGLFGEQPVDRCYVFYVPTLDIESASGDGATIPQNTADFPRVRRARQLFPEAQIVAVWVNASQAAELFARYPELVDGVSD